MFSEIYSFILEVSQKQYNYLYIGWLFVTTLLSSRTSTFQIWIGFIHRMVRPIWPFCYWKQKTAWNPSKVIFSLGLFCVIAVLVVSSDTHWQQNHKQQERFVFQIGDKYFYNLVTYSEVKTRVHHKPCWNRKYHRKVWWMFTITLYLYVFYIYKPDSFALTSFGVKLTKLLQTRWFTYYDSWLLRGTPLILGFKVCLQVLGRSTAYMEAFCYSKGNSMVSVETVSARSEAQTV